MLHPSFILFGLFIRSCASPFHFSLPSKVANNPMRIQRPMDAKNPHTHSLRAKTSWPSFIQHVLWGRFVSASCKGNWKKKHPTEGSRGYKGAFPKCFDAWDACHKWHKWQREVLWPLIQQEACGGIVFASFFQFCSLKVLLWEKKDQYEYTSTMSDVAPNNSAILPGLVRESRDPRPPPLGGCKESSESSPGS